MPEAVERARHLIRSTIRYRDHLASEDAVVSRHWALFGLTSSPWASLLRAPGVVVGVSGMVSNGFDPGSLRATPDLAGAISELSGRFSAAVAEPGSRRLAVATSPTRVDSVFAAEDQEKLILGTQASVVCRLLHGGRLEYAPEALYSFINTGFYGSDATPYAGVRALAPLETVHLDGAAITRRSPGLWSLRQDRTLQEHVQACSEALTAALAPAADSPSPVKVGLSGGKDSRLVLAGLLAAGIEPWTSTLDHGASNQADVWVAKQIAEMTGVPHLLRPGGTAGVEDGRNVQRVDLLARAAGTLRSSDGMNSVHDLIATADAFDPNMTVGGHGGEMLRGGYAEYAPDADAAEARRRAHKQFGAFARCFDERRRARYGAELDGWLAAHEAQLDAPDVLDVMYAYFRMGRWAAGAIAGAMTRLFPLADNRFTREVLAVPAGLKADHRLFEGILRRLDFRLADFPLANKFYATTPPEERERLRGRYPEAYAKPVPVPGRAVDWRAHPHPVLVDHVREYCVAQGRIDLLDGVVDRTAVEQFFAEGDANKRGNRKFLFGLYSACVLLSEDWERPGHAHPLAIPLGG